LNPETGTYEGFDIDVATEIAKRLGVGIDWATPDWEVLTAGSWNDRWEMSVGSMTPIAERQKVLNFTEPYSFVPAVVVVHNDSTVTDVTTDLDGKKIGVCSDCTYQFFLEKTLEIPGFEFNFVIDDATVQGYDTDTTALQDLALGDGTRLDAVLTSITTAEAFAKENPVKIVGDPIFGEPLAIAFDKSSDLDGTSLKDAVDAMVADMHSDGTLTELSKKWYDGIDVTNVAA
jgi:polar amino acid transport system substrate-binding protein